MTTVVKQDINKYALSSQGNLSSNKSQEKIEFTAHQTKRPLLQSMMDIREKLIF